MKMSADGVVRAVPAMIRAIVSLGCLTLLSCGTGDGRPETSGTMVSRIITLDPPATVVTGEPSTRSATCPGHQLPDQCGSWAGVELQAKRAPDPRPRADVTTGDDEHCLCEPIDFVIPSELPVTAGTSGGEWDKAKLSFRTASGKVVECEYRGNFEDRHGPHPASGGDKYILQSCNKGFKAGQSTQSDWFQLELGDGHGSKANVEVSLRLGEPDVVGGVVQEQIFYAHDARAPGAALHVPRGSAPNFESFSLDVVPQVPPGTPIENGGDSATAVGYAVDVHSDSRDSFVFTPVPGTCPRIDLPYDPVRLEALLGPGRESALNASHLTSVAAIAGGGHVLEPFDPVTVDLANHTVSFCVEHLSIYLGLVGANNASIELAQLMDGSALVADLRDDSVRTLPVLSPNKTYTLNLRFQNTGAQWLSSTVKLVAVDKPNGTTITQLPASSAAWVSAPTWTNGRTLALPISPVDNGDTVTFSFDVKAPTTPAPMNFCLRSGSASYFGECFSYDPHAYTAGTGSAGVPTTEVCDGVDNDLNGFTDEGVTHKFYADADRDGYGNPSAAKDACTVPDGYVDDSSDCNDNDAATHPAAYYPDCDGDDHGSNEVCLQPANQESTPITYVYPVVGCVAPPAPVNIDFLGTTIIVNYVTSDDDCNDRWNAIYPGAPETCDYLDNNCADGTNDESRTVGYRYDRDNDGWCQPGSVPGCPGSAPYYGMRESSQCDQLIAPPTVVTSDCNDDNSQASTFCGEYFHTISETFTVDGGLFGNVDYGSFHTNCGPGWHVSRCEATRTSNDGNVSISYCPVGAVGGDITIRFGISALLSVSGYGTAYCEANSSYP